ncbi:hypothetical protein [Rhizobium sp. LjRoot254]|uniref:hypothetical protein n=1 Tax=Rhizobium sp. LjRoot254 TaxID=3342297 RepID=UPI003ED11D96
MSRNTRIIALVLGVVVLAIIAYSMLGDRTSGPGPATTTTTTPADTTQPTTNTQ